jgi:type IV pilus assembly protein PilE
MKNRQRGVTLMELLTVVTVLGILTSVSVPTYRQYVMRAQRTEAKSALMARAGALERCFTRFNAYDDDDCEVAGSFPEDLAEGHYTITAPTLAAGTFTLNAVPKGGQEDDVDCKTLTLDSRNQRGVTGGAARDALYCWSR